MSSLTPQFVAEPWPRVLDAEGTSKAFWSTSTMDPSSSLVNGIAPLSLRSLAETVELFGITQDLTQ